MRTATTVLASMLTMAALTGCLGLGGSDDNSTDGTNTTNGTNGTGNNTTDPGEPSGAVQRENRTGTATGIDLIVASEGGAEETFSVANGTQSLSLAFGAEGGELSYCVRAPSTEEDSCDGEGETSDGNATFTTELPAEGTWTVVLVPAGPGPGSVDYTLTITMVLGDE